MSRNNKIILLGIILLIGFFLRFYKITSLPPGLYHDEAMNGNNAIEALTTGNFKVFYPENNGREGLFINLQAISIAIFGNQIWALRIVSAIFGVFTILGVYLLAKEIFIKNKASEYIALFSSFFLATSYWHVNFSRIGLRAISLPFFCCFALFFLLRGLRKKNIVSLICAGVFSGLGFYSYIAFRFMPFILLMPVIYYLFKKISYKYIFLYVIIVLAVALPIGLYFIENLEQFYFRADEISILNGNDPARLFKLNNFDIWNMLFLQGDGNFRHNYNFQPELNIIVFIFFLSGIGMLLFLLAKNRNLFLVFMIFAWLYIMSLPATLTMDNTPHVLRAIGLLPPIMIIAGFGSGFILFKLQTVLFSKEKYLFRIFFGIFISIVLCVPLQTYNVYFNLWSKDIRTEYYFQKNITDLGFYLKGLPNDQKKYVILNFGELEIAGMNIPKQPVMYITDTYLPADQLKKNIEYVTMDKINTINIDDKDKIIICFLSNKEKKSGEFLLKKFPQLKMKNEKNLKILTN